MRGPALSLVVFATFGGLVPQTVASPLPQPQHTVVPHTEGSPPPSGCSGSGSSSGGPSTPAPTSTATTTTAPAPASDGCSGGSSSPEEYGGTSSYSPMAPSVLYMSPLDGPYGTLVTIHLVDLEAAGDALVVIANPDQELILAPPSRPMPAGSDLRRRAAPCSDGGRARRGDLELSLPVPGRRADRRHPRRAAPGGGRLSPHVGEPRPRADERRPCDHRLLHPAPDWWSPMPAARRATTSWTVTATLRRRAGAWAPR